MVDDAQKDGPDEEPRRWSSWMAATAFAMIALIVVTTIILLVTGGGGASRAHLEKFVSAEAVGVEEVSGELSGDASAAGRGLRVKVRVKLKNEGAVGLATIAGEVALAGPGGAELGGPRRVVLIDAGGRPPASDNIERYAVLMPKTEAVVTAGPFAVPAEVAGRPVAPGEITASVKVTSAVPAASSY